jgi:hypothetical protein
MTCRVIRRQMLFSKSRMIVDSLSGRITNRASIAEY